MIRFTLLLSTIVCTFLPIAFADDPQAEDITNNGNYLISRCGKDIPGGKAENLISLFREIGGDLPTIIMEANSGEDSKYGSKSLFTSNDAIPTVTENFGKLSDSQSVVINGQSKQITFVCLEPNE